MSYYSDTETEKKRIQLEKTIRAEYSRAYKEMKETAQTFYDGLDERFEAERIKFENGKTSYKDQADFDNWRLTQIKRADGYFTMTQKLADRMVNANEIACAYINDTTPTIFSLNHNYEAYRISQEVGSVDFQLVDEQTVKELMMGNNHTDFKVAKVNKAKDYKWNTKQIHSALTAGILQGKSIDRIADSYLTVMERNKNSAIRNARTSVTSAQNAGRNASYQQAVELGIEIQKEWLSCLDSRTRDSHQRLDGERVDYNDKFSNGLEYPADPSGAPREVYNCRCTMRAYLPKYDNVLLHRAYKDENGQREYNSRGEALTMFNTTYRGRNNTQSYSQWLNKKLGIKPADQNDYDVLYNKPQRPKKSDYSDYETYLKAREAYRKQILEYEETVYDWIEKNKPAKMTESEILEALSRNNLYVYNTIDGIDSSVFRAFINRYEVLKDDFPEVEEIAKKIYYNNMVNVQFTGDTSYLIEASGGFNFGSWCGDFTKLVDNRISQVSDGYIVKGQSPINGLFDHEFGHNFYCALKYRDGMDTQKRVDMSNDLRNSLLGKDGISDYATVNEDELFAEAFSAWYGREKNDFTKAFEEFLGRWR